MSSRQIVCWFLLALLATGCGTQFKYGDATYSTREEAVQAVRNDTETSVAGVLPQSERLGGRVLIVIPTRTVIQAHGVQSSGAADPDSVGYIVDVLEIGLLAAAEGVRKGEIFDDSTLLRDDNTENVLYDTYDYKLWLFSGGPTTWQWYLSRKGVTEREPVSADIGLEKADRMNSFNEAVVRAGERLDAKRISDFTPSQ